MWTGKQKIRSIVTLAAITALTAVPTAAVETSNVAAGSDELPPEPVFNLEAFAGAGGVELTWEASPSDFLRPAPTGTGFTGTGTFTNVNDVARYNVRRNEAGDLFELVGSVQAGRTTFVDAAAVAGSTILYRVTAVDAAGNESEVAETLINLGDPPVALIHPAVTSIDFGDVAPDQEVSSTFEVTNLVTGTGAQLRVTVSVSGAGFSSPTASAFTLDQGVNNTATIQVTFAAAVVGNRNDDYRGTLTIGTNDPDQRQVVVALRAQITTGLNPQRLRVTPPLLRFSTQRLINTTGSRQIELTNTGGEQLTGSWTLTGSPAFSSAANRLINRAPGTSRTILIDFRPTEAGQATGSLTFSTNDPVDPVVTVDLTGRGVTSITGAGKVVARVAKARVVFNTTVDLEDDDQVDAFVTTFRTRMASGLRIAVNRIRNVRLSQGSVVVDFEVAKTGAEAPDEPTAEEAVADLQAQLADPAAPSAIRDELEQIAPVTEVADLTEDVEILPEDELGGPVYGWFTRQGTSVGLDDFFQFADFFGFDETQGEFDPLYDIFPPEDPDGDINLDDFFLFADDFGKTVVNAEEIQNALQ